MKETFIPELIEDEAWIEKNSLYYNLWSKYYIGFTY